MPYLIVGTVPPDSRATALAGRHFRLPATTPADVERRVTEAYRSGTRPRITLTEHAHRCGRCGCMHSNSGGIPGRGCLSCGCACSPIDGGRTCRCCQASDK